jgi:Family of unknown function (DUF5701)
VTRSTELDRQLETLLDLGYPALADVDEPTFRSYVDPLHDLVRDLAPPAAANIPFLLVVRATTVPTVRAVERFDVRGRKGWTDMHDEIDTYRLIEGVEVPEGPAYLLADVSTGPETLDVRPDDALPMIRAAGRTPLTTDEGVALVTQFPEVFAERNAFQAVGSRSGVAPYLKRVPSFWMSKGAPRLGWCWAGNPHTWLGSASAAARVATG